jgi:HSP90 family molecular chaperone
MIKLATKYKDYKLVNVSKERLNFNDKDREEHKKEKEELNSEHKVVKEYLKAVLAGKVQHVKMTLLLSDYPAALVQTAYGMSPTMQWYMKAQNVYAK